MNNKDPAFLFYSSDFLTGTMLMTDEQVGKYVRILCLQHQRGHLNDKQMMQICKTYDEDIFSKFVTDGNGLYYNVRLDAEIEKRRKYSESRSKNRLSKKDEKDMSSICQSHDVHMENENENINKDISNKVSKKDISNKAQKHKYGAYQNVLLSDDDFQKLLNEFPYDYQERIESLSEGIASKGYKYKDHLATIRSWARREKKDKPKNEANDYLTQVIKEGMRNESNRDSQDYETDPVTVPKLLQGSR